MPSEIAEKGRTGRNGFSGKQWQGFFPELTGRSLKLIALFFMLLDHGSIVIVERGILKSGDPLSTMRILQTASGMMWRRVDWCFRCAGRLAFPIYIFLLVEGFVHTRRRKTYGMRLFFFALLSEIPFDLAIFGQTFYPAYQNVMFTLLIAYITLCGVEKFRGSRVMQILCPLAGCLAAELFRVDYGAVGVIMAVLLYLYRGSGVQLKVTAAVAVLESLRTYGMAALSVFFLRLYRGKEGKWPGKYFFYFAYPGHLLALALLYRIVFA